MREIDYPYWGFPNGTGNIDLNISHQESKRILALLTEVNTPALAGLQDPLSVAWELLPYSFVLDWFIPVGNYLQARALPQAISGQYIISYRRRARLNFLWIHQTSGSEQIIWKKRAEGSYEQYSFTRSITTTLPNPPLPKIKPLGSVPSWQKALTSVALLVGLRK